VEIYAKENPVYSRNVHHYFAVNLRWVETKSFSLLESMGLSTNQQKQSRVSKIGTVIFFLYLLIGSIKNSHDINGTPLNITINHYYIHHSSLITTKIIKEYT
jgi:hypothetical protein